MGQADDQPRTRTTGTNDAQERTTMNQYLEVLQKIDAHIARMEKAGVFPDKHYGFRLNWGADEIDIDFTEYWAYGGSENRTVTISTAEIFCDDPQKALDTRLTAEREAAQKAAEEKAAKDKQDALIKAQRELEAAQKKLAELTTEA